MLMNPGATTKPVASISRVPLAFLSSPMAAIVSAFMATLPTYVGFPEPSAIVPFFIKIS